MMLAPEEEAQLRRKAGREGQQTETVTHAVLVQALEWEAQDRAEAVAGIQRGIDAFEQGRFRRFSEFRRSIAPNMASPLTPGSGRRGCTTR